MLRLFLPLILLAGPAAAQLRPLPAGGAGTGPLPLSDAWAAGARRFDGLAVLSPLAAASLPTLKSLRPLPAPAARPTAFATVPLSAAPEPIRYDVRRPETWSALQRHVSFFDLDGDGVITVSETRRALAQLGFGRLVRWPTAYAIHLGLSRTTGGAGLNILIEGIARGKHPGDSGAYDAEGRYVESKFDAIFDRFDKDRDGALSWTELRGMIDANGRGAKRAAGLAEFGLLFKAAADRTVRVGGKKVKALSRARMASFYEGSLLYDLAGRTPPWKA